MSITSDALERSATYFDTGAFASDLGRLVAVPSESQEERGRPHLIAYLEDHMRPLLEGMGFTCRMFPNPVPDAGPFMVAERIEGAELPTVLTYGHGDVVRGQDAQWRSGLKPFVLLEDGDRLYGRGTADNKSQHLINLKALDALLAVQGYAGFNFKILLETGEEIGSPGLKQFCAENAELLKADVFIASDGPRISPDTPTLFTGSRGGITFDLQVNLRGEAHHSGNFGGLLADPALILAHALATITDQRGEILIPEWLPNSLTEDVRKVLAKLPPVDPGFALDADWGQADLSMAERVFGWNSFAVLAMTSGQPDAPVNAISGSARATCQLRYVVGTPVDDILPALRRALDKKGLYKVEIVPSKDAPFPATRLDLGNPWLSFVANSLEAACGTAPDLLPNLGGSLPNDCFSDVLGLPTIWVPHSYAGCCQHAPNEHILKPVARQALLGMTGVFADISRLGRSQDRSWLM